MWTVHRPRSQYVVSEFSARMRLQAFTGFCTVYEVI